MPVSRLPLSLQPLHLLELAVAIAEFVGHKDRTLEEIQEEFMGRFHSWGDIHRAVDFLVKSNELDYGTDLKFKANGWEDEDNFSQAPVPSICCYVEAGFSKKVIKIGTFTPVGSVMRNALDPFSGDFAFVPLDKTVKFRRIPIPISF